MEEVLGALRARFGESWTKDTAANARFATGVGHLLHDLSSAHMIGEPDLDDDEVVVTLWVDAPLRDLMEADQLAYEVFARVSHEIFYTERRFAERALRYPFVTGSSLHGHIGVLVLAGPHAADFASLHRSRMGVERQFQA
ncbi:MAG: hypothetical protein M3R06_01745 [Chloroflexota bacterium]|nr:hypothetical protein [Chloroflexota bacterium]